MLNQFVSSAISVIVTGSIGYLIAIIKGYRKRDKSQEEALKCLLRSNITSKYYVYKELGSIPIYEKENINYMFEQYKSMGGNSYIDNVVKEINNLPVK